MKDNRSAVLIGICGGFQMLGTKIRDPYKAESRQGDVDGLGILKMETIFGKDKVLSQVKAVEARSGLVVSGYEIHHGKSRNIKKYAPVFNIIDREGE